MNWIFLFHFSNLFFSHPDNWSTFISCHCFRNYCTIFFQLLFYSFSMQAEIFLNLPHMWLNCRKRTLPYWSVPCEPFLSLARLFLRAPVVANLLSFALIGSLFAASFFSAAFLVPASVCLALACLLDLWKLFYYSYWWFLITALALGTQQRTTQIYLASLYFYSGLTKLLKPDFYRVTAPSTMQPFVELLNRVVSRGTNEQKAAVIGGVGVFLEALLGAVLGLYAYDATLVPSWVLLSALGFNLIGLHIYICVAIGLRHHIFTFLSWNAQCAVLGQQCTPWTIFHSHSFRW